MATPTRYVCLQWHFALVLQLGQAIALPMNMEDNNKSFSTLVMLSYLCWKAGGEQDTVSRTFWLRERARKRKRGDSDGS